ncbi:hypothetical protein E4U14_004090 [Claviceps sp. LM454 group G7]|nr:hypothetical protein E4U14_004090 [Claviceps sp. LM454 group G7]
MASDPLKYPDTRDTAVISNEFVATNDSESREEESSTGILDSAAVRAVDAPPIAVGSQTDDDIDLSSVEGDDATASLTSSLLFAHTMNTAATTQEDMKHAMLMMLTENKPFLAPIGDHPQKILDIGTGTGIWAIDVGDRYPSAKREMPTLPTFGTHRSLRPGGWIELQEMLTKSLCDDGTMPDDDPVKYLCETATRAFEKCGMKTTLAPNLEPHLREAGFETSIAKSSRFL